MEKFQILWADDEIELLKPYVMFLKEKEYDVTTCNSGVDAIDLVTQTNFDIVFLDENMPGLSGLETLTKIKSIRPQLPIIMITKSEQEQIMEDAIGSKIADYLIKPVNPNQILLTLKKILDHKRLIREKTTKNYQQEFRQLGMQISPYLSWQEWVELYKKLIFWELELEKSRDESMFDMLLMQKHEANTNFARFISNNYEDWVNMRVPDVPTLSHTLFKNKIAPEIDKPENLYLIVIDNLRYDQWKSIEPIISEYFRVDKEEVFFSILPTATHYARNSLFAGLMPSEIAKRHPQYWVGESETDEGKNQYEAELLGEQLRRLGKNVKHSYNKITNLTNGKKLAENFYQLDANKLNVVVYNFVDMLSHARTDMEVIKELADDEAAYRALTVSWFEHSPLWEMMQQISDKKGRMIITTDHGTIKVKEATQVIGDKNTNTNLRYKVGKALDYDPDDVFEVKNPTSIFLPKENVSSSYIFAKTDLFFAYRNNYNYYVSYYKNTFQHGGVSLEEMIIPVITLSSR